MTCTVQRFCVQDLLHVIQWCCVQDLSLTCCTLSTSSKCGVQCLLTYVWCSRFTKHNNVYICMICTFIYSELVKKIYVQLHCMCVYVCVCVYIFTCSSLLRIIFTSTTESCRRSAWLVSIFTSEGGILSVSIVLLDMQPVPNQF